MKKLSLLFISLFGTLLSFSNINFVLDYALFKSDNNQQYAEFYISINGNSVLYKQTSDSLFQANIEITYLIEQGDKVVSFKKFQINSPEYTEKAFKLDLIDLKRLNIPKGKFTYTVIAKDLTSGSEGKISDSLRYLEPNNNQIQFSELQIASQLTSSQGDGVFIKNGFDIIPSVSRVFNNSNNTIYSYFEIYNANKTIEPEGAYLLDMRIEDAFTSRIIGGLRGIKRLNANAITPIIQQFKLDNIPTGSYNFVIEAKNRNNEIIANQSSSFYRVNNDINVIKELVIEGTFVDTMRSTKLLGEYIKSLRPISTDDERIWADNQLKYAELELMQKFFYNFWRERNQSDPAFAWFEYKEKVRFVDEKFGYGGVSGYTTERGRVYLQYGAPNSVQDVPYDGETYAYSIWQYYKLNNFVNQRFVFFSPTNGMVGYEVLHSTYPGEVKNEDWQNSLSSKRVIPGNEQRDGGIHPNVQDIFDNPR